MREEEHNTVYCALNKRVAKNSQTNFYLLVFFFQK